MIDALRFLATTAWRQLDGLIALALYPIRRRALVGKLERAIPQVNIETTNICNANCVFCAYQYQDRPTGVMSMALFRKVVDEYAEAGGGDVGLTPTVGDPLVDPHLLERIAYLRGKPAIRSIHMFSNMILLHRIGADALARSGLTQLTVSMSGFDDAMYRRVYRSKMYPRVIENVKAFARANAAAGRPVKYVLDLRVDQPLAEVYAGPDYAEVADLVGAENINVKFRYDSWGGRIAEKDLSGNMRLRRNSPLLRPRVSACTEMYNGPAVYWDGKVGACNCRDVNARELMIGDIARERLTDIWFGAPLRKMRAGFTRGETPAICRDCTHYNNLSIYLRRDRKALLRAIAPCIRTKAGPAR